MCPTVFGALSCEPDAEAVRGQERVAAARRCPSGRRGGLQCHPVYTGGKILLSRGNRNKRLWLMPAGFPQQGGVVILGLK